MSNESIKLREPGQRVLEKPQPKLTLIEPTPGSKPMGPASELSPEVKEMLREMNHKVRSRDQQPDMPDAA